MIFFFTAGIICLIGLVSLIKSASYLHNIDENGYLEDEKEMP
jgi:hypothetical protein